jgi:membrane fusion protein (multidrug efflux system)
MRRIKTLIIPLSIIVALFGCNQQKQENKTEKENNKTIVTTAKSEQKTYHPWQEYNGTAYAYKEANLGTALPGRVEDIHYEVGDYVNKGDLLVELSAELYAQALAEKNTLKKDFNRVKRLREKGSVSQQKYDHTKAKYEAAKAKARMMKKNCEIRAPFSGTIVDFLVQEGENFMFSPSLKPNYTHTSGIVQLMQLDKIKVEIDVNESSLKDVSVGQQAKLIFDAYPQDEYKGTVSKIKPILNTETHSATTEITVNNREKKIKPGMYANVEIKLPETEDVFIPLNSIYRQPGTGNDFVFVVKNNNTVVRKPIERKYTMGDKVAVTGIEKNRKIVVNGKNKLNAGDKVIVDNS